MKKAKKFLAALLSVVSAAGMANMATAMHGRNTIDGDYSGPRKRRRLEQGTSSASSTIESRRPEPDVPLIYRDYHSLKRDDIVKYVLPTCFRYLVAVLKYEKYESPYRGAKQILEHCFWQMGHYDGDTVEGWLDYFTYVFRPVHDLVKNNVECLNSLILRLHSRGRDPMAFLLLGNHTKCQDYWDVIDVLTNVKSCGSPLSWQDMHVRMSKVHPEIKIPPKYQRWLEDLDIL